MVNREASMTSDISNGQMNRGWTYQNRVEKPGETLLDYYTTRYRHSSRSEWQVRIESGQIWIDGKRAHPETCLVPGQILTYQRLPWREPEVSLAFMQRYEDDDLWVIEKPAGLPVLPGGGFLEHTLLWQLQQRYPQDTPLPVHRLGRGTSGLMLLARSPQVRAQLSQQFRAATAQIGDRPITKVYLAVVVGQPPCDRFTITIPIGKVPHPNLGQVFAAHPQGKSARSDVVVLQRGETVSLVEVTIFTGRPHQIRIHLAAAGYPLQHDPFYQMGGIPRVNPDLPGAKLPVPGDCGYALHAHRLAFLHPATHRHLDFVSDFTPAIT